VWRIATGASSSARALAASARLQGRIYRGGTRRVPMCRGKVGVDMRRDRARDKCPDKCLVSGARGVRLWI